MLARSRLLVPVAFALGIAAISAALGVCYLRAPYVDLPSFYYASQAIRAGASPYVDLAPFAGEFVHPFLYAPPSTLLFYPLGWLTIETAGVALGILGLLAAGVAAFSLRQVRPIAGMHAVLCVLLVYGSQAFRSNLYHGQVNLLVAAGICACWANAARRPTLAGFALAPALIVKLQPSLYLLALFLSAKRRSLLACIAATVAASLATLALLPAVPWGDFLRLVSSASGDSFALASSPDNMSLRGLGQTAYVAMTATMLAVSAFSLWRARSLDHGFMVLAPLIFLVSPLSWEHHLIYLAPAFVVATHDLLAARRWPALAVCATCMAVCFAPVLPDAAWVRGAVTVAAGAFWMTAVTTTIVPALGFSPAAGNGALPWNSVSPSRRSSPSFSAPGSTPTC